MVSAIRAGAAGDAQVASHVPLPATVAPRQAMWGAKGAVIRLLHAATGQEGSMGGNPIRQHQCARRDAEWITPLPNQGAEVATITDLFDRIAELIGVRLTFRASGRLTASLSVSRTGHRANTHLPVGRRRSGEPSRHGPLGAYLTTDRVFAAAGVGQRQLHQVVRVCRRRLARRLCRRAPRIFFDTHAGTGGLWTQTTRPSLGGANYGTMIPIELAARRLLPEKTSVLVIRSTRPRKHMTSACS